MLFVMVITFYTSRVILQTLGVTDYGIYNVVGGVVLMIDFVRGPLNAAAMRFLTYELGRQNKEKLAKIFACTLNIQIVIGALLVILVEIIGLWFFYNKLVIPYERMNVAFWVFQFSVITMFFDYTQIPYSASITSHEDMAVYAYVGLYEAISKLAIVYFIQMCSWDKLWLYAFLIMTNKMLVMVYYRIYSIHHYEECHFRLFWDKKIYTNIVSYASWNLFGGFAVICEGQGLNILLNLFFGPVVNAARAISVQVQSAVTLLVSNFLTAVRPQVIKNFANKKYDEMYKLTFDTSKYAYFLMFIFILPILFELNSILELWLGNTVPTHTPAITTVILITSLINTIDQSYLLAFHAIGKVKFGNIVGGTFMMLTVPLGYISLKLGMPPVSVYFIVMVVNVISTIFDFFLIHHYVPFKIMRVIKETLMPMMIVTLISIVLPACLVCLYPPSWMRMIINVSLTIIVTLLTIIYFGLQKTERSAIFTMLNNKIRELSRNK